MPSDAGVSYNQEAILNKLSLYLNLLQQHDDAVDKIQIKTLQEELLTGSCQGLSICFSAFFATGYLDWWLGVLDGILKWDNRWESLHEEIDLTHSNRKVSRLEIFERALNYVVFYQGRYPNFAFFDNQNDILNKVGVFEFLTKKGKFVIEKKQTIAGYFTKEQLRELITEKIGRFCIVHNPCHAVSIGYSENKWVFYDPNAEGLSKFDTKDQLIDKMASDLGCAIAISACSLKNKSAENQNETLVLNEETNTFFPLFNQDFIAANAIGLINEFWLGMIVKTAPKQLGDLLELAKNNIELQKALEIGFGGLEGFAVIARYAPEQLTDLLEFAQSTTGLKSALAREALGVQSNVETKDGIIKALRTHSNAELKKAIEEASAAQDNTLPVQPERLTWADLIKLSQKRPKLQEAMLKVLSLEGCDGLGDLARQAPEQLAVLFALAKNDAELQISIAKAKRLISVARIKRKKEKTDFVALTGLWDIATYAPKQLTGLFELAKSSPELQKAMAKGIVSWRGSFLYNLAKHAPEQLTGLLALAKNNIKLQKAITKDLDLQGVNSSRSGLLSGIGMFARGQKANWYVLTMQRITEMKNIISTVGSVVEDRKSDSKKNDLSAKKRG